MPKKLGDIERDVMELSTQERALLAERLLATLDPGEDTDAEELWLEEAEKRYADYRVVKLSGRRADQVFEEARHRLVGSE